MTPRSRSPTYGRHLSSKVRALVDFAADKLLDQRRPDPDSRHARCATVNIRDRYYDVLPLSNGRDPRFCLRVKTLSEEIRDDRSDLSNTRRSY